jgi:uncharacterized membrane protein
MEVILKPILKPLLGALAGASLLAAPFAADAQAHGGHGGGGFHGGGHSASGFHGGGFRGGGYRGGGYYRGGYPFVGGLGLGLAFGSLAAPWYYDGYYGPDPSYSGYAPDYGYDYAPPPPVAAGPPAACGNWSWNAGRNQYDWVPC